MQRTVVIAEVKTCPNGWDPDNCYDSGRGLNPCGTDHQHCQGNGTSVEVMRPSGAPIERFLLMISMIDCECSSTGLFTEVLTWGGDESAWVTGCVLCRVLKAAAVASAFGSCTVSPR